MAEPPVVMFGRSNRDNRWWAVLPSEQLVHGDNVTELLDRVDEAMAREAPGRPFALSLDSSGKWEPYDSSPTVNDFDADR